MAQLTFLSAGLPASHSALADFEADWLTRVASSRSNSLDLLNEAGPPGWLGENVTGSLQADGGRAFASFLGGLAKLGYGFAYRVLDVRQFGLPHQRPRVFVVANRGSWRRAAGVLFDRQSLSGAAEKVGAARPTLSVVHPVGAQAASVRIDAEPFAYCLQRTCYDYSRSDGFNVVVQDDRPRRLTVRECERLLGFPDDFTAVPFRGRIMPDVRRYQMLGNSIAVPALAWIGERIQALDALEASELGEAA